MALQRRCGGACEQCGLEWPWALYVFLADPGSGARSANLIVLCAACSEGRPGAFAPLLDGPTLRDKLRERNNRRTGATKLTAARRRELIAARGDSCEVCHIPGTERQLDVHHVLGVFRGGDDSFENLMVLCFACHHHLQPCATGCGRWAKKPATLCRHCGTRLRLEEIYPGLGWTEIKNLLPGLARTWPPGYEPRPAPQRLL